MNKKINEYSNFVDGAASFRGGPYGFGGKTQLATDLNPATQKMADQEDAEKNKNVEDLHRTLGVYRSPTQKAIRYADFDISQSPTVKSRPETDMFAPAPKGSSNTRENFLADPQTFVPMEKPRNEDDYLIDDMAEELADNIVSNLTGKNISEGSFIDYSFNPYNNKTYVDLDPKNSSETLGHTVIPGAEHAASIGMGAVLLPKAFVPEDTIAKQNNKNPITGLPKSDNIEYAEQNFTENEQKNINELKILINSIITELLNKG